MKVMLMALALAFSATAFANVDPMACLKVKNALDRRYCMDKYLETVKQRNAQEKQTWTGNLTAQTKAERAAALEQEIQMKREHAALIQSEIALTESHTKELKATPEAVAAAPTPAKKKKDKRLIRFKF